MSWKLVISPHAVKQLAKLDKPTAKLITSCCEKIFPSVRIREKKGKHLALTLQVPGAIE